MFHYQWPSCIKRQKQNLAGEKKRRPRMQTLIAASATSMTTTATMMIISILLVQLALLSVKVASADPTAKHHRHQQKQQHHHQSQSASSGGVFDEEINFEPLYDYDRTSAAAADTSLPATGGSGSQIAPDPASLAYSDEARPSRADYNGDPFAATFEEYLKEANENSANQMVADDAFVASDSDNARAAALPNKAANPSYVDGSDNPSTMATTAPETATARPRETPIIDYIFPPPAPSSSSAGQEQQQQQVHDHQKQDNSHTASDGSSAGSNNNKSTSSNDLLLNEIKLLFGWKQFHTSKCSKPCGRGQQINHLSCVDLKYDVKVEDELCLKSSVPKPNELSDEPCNQIDCPPQWVSIEEPLHNCADVANQTEGAATPGGQRHNHHCQAGVYKRAQCVMVDRTGATVHVDADKCATTESSHQPADDHEDRQHQQQHHHRQPEAHKSSSYDDESVDLIGDSMPSGADDENDFNRILADSSASAAAAEAAGSMAGSDLPEEPMTLTGGGQHPHNEPFFEAGPWSACFGDQCGQLGKRFRKLVCRIYLSRSARYADLPESSCQGAPQPDTQEPCFIDCGGARDEPFIVNATQEANQIVEQPSLVVADQQQQRQRSQQQDDLISVVSGVHIEQKANHVLVLDSRSGRKEMMSNEQLIGMPLKVLTKTMAGFPKEVLSRVKQLRRTLRSNNHSPGSTTTTSAASAVCRSNNPRREHRGKLERRNAELLEELRQKDRRIAELEKRVLTCEFDNSILAA